MQALTERTESQLAVRATIDALEQSMRKGIEEGELEHTFHDGETDEGDSEATHHFADGVYARTLVIPAGCIVVGKIHKQSRICIISQGRCQFIDEFHKEEVEAPWIGEFRGGTKTAVFALTDTTWTACVGTDIKDPQQALRELSAKTYQDYNEWVAALPAPETEEGPMNVKSGGEGCPG